MALRNVGRRRNTGRRRFGAGNRRHTEFRKRFEQFRRNLARNDRGDEGGLFELVDRILHLN